MAKKKYYRNFNELMVGIYEGCQEAFNDTCEQLREDVEDLVSDVYIYGKPEQTYDRTFEMESGIVDVEIDGLNAEIVFNDDPIETIDNPHHHALEQGETMEGLVDLATGGRLQDIKNYVYNKFPKIFRDKMKNYQ